MSNQDEGREALIHLHVPAALKARWVRESRAAGMKLTDWIIERMERPMPALKITGAVASQYHGSGWALAAVTGSQIVALRYLADVLPDFDPDEHGGIVAVKNAIDDARLAPTVRELQALGEVSVGMCSCWEFIEL